MSPAPHSSAPSASQRIVRGAVQTVGSVYVARLSNWVANILLMRGLVLTKEEFGIAALAIAALTMISSLRRFGLHFALIHQHDDVQRLVPTHFFLNVGLGAISTFAAILLCPLYISDRYGAMVASALAVYAVADFFRNAVMTTETQLRRDLRFGVMAVAHAGATIAASAVALALAYSGFGVWALVLGFFVNNSIAYVVVYVGALWWHRPPPIARAREFDRDGARTLMRFGFWFWVGAVMQGLTLYFDKLVVGAVLGTAVLGVYNQAHLLAQIPTGAVTHTIMGVTGAVYARYQDDRRRLSQVFLRTQRLIARATVPLTMVLAVEAPQLVELLVGSEWLDLVPVLRWLILFSLTRPILEDINALLFGLGKTRVTARFAFAQGAFVLIGAPLATQYWGVVGTAISMDMMAILGLALATRAASGFVDIPWLRTLGLPLLAAAAALGVRLLTDPLTQSLPPFSSLVAGAAVFGATYAGALLLLERSALVEDIRSFKLAYARRPR